MFMKKNTQKLQLHNIICVNLSSKLLTSCFLYLIECIQIPSGTVLFSFLISISLALTVGVQGFMEKETYYSKQVNEFIKFD